MIELILNENDLKRLVKNGVGGGTTYDEQMALIALAREALEYRQLDADFEERFGGLADKENNPVAYTTQG